MKQLVIIVSITLLAASCSKDKTAGITAAAAVNGTTKLSGSFYATAGITVSGNAKVVSDGTSFTLLLDAFTVSAGPDLKVYLSKKDTPFEFVNLGPLKSNSGNQSYAIPQGIDMSEYKFALIHCQQYNHLFAIAALNP
jgi:hypothetical protein